MLRAKGGFGLKLRRLPRAEIDQRVREIAALLGLTSFLNRLPQSLSGGERQRVALGRAIVRRPKVFLFDEPLSQLDAPLRLQMRREIARLHRQLGATMIYVTHDQNEALALGQKIAVLNGGAIQQVADALTLYRQPQNLFVAGFMGSPPMNLFCGRLMPRREELHFTSNEEGVSFQLDAAMRGKLAEHTNREVIFGIRPEHIFLTSPSSTNGMDPQMTAFVELIEPSGADTIVHLRVAKNAFAIKAAAEAAPVVNEKVTVRFELAKGHVFDPATQARIE